MELSPPSQANSHSARQEIPSFLWNTKLYYHDHRNSPLVTILNQMKTVQHSPIYVSTPTLPHMLHARTSHHRFHHHNNLWWSLQLM